MFVTIVVSGNCNGMNGRSETFLSNNGKRIIFSLLALIMFYLISYLIDPYAIYWKDFFNKPVKTFLMELGFGIFFCALISECSIFINAEFNKYLPWIEKPILRLVLETSMQIVATLIIVAAEFSLVYLLDEKTNLNLGQEEMTGIFQWVMVSLLIALMISGINTLNYLISNWKKTSVQVAEYKQAAAEAELHALKLQVDPHFVFNNLSVLSEVILEDQQLGYQYAENFARVYRYLLLNAKKDLISLKEELKFIEAYIFLIKNRVGDAVIFDIAIDQDYLNFQLPPLTMQILIENVLKHNKTIKSDPLRIDIKMNSDHELVISNTIIALEKRPLSSGIGLQNILNRYQLLSNKTLEIEQTETRYTVRVPLLKLISR